MIKKYSLQTQGILLALLAMLLFSVNDGIYKYLMQTVSMNMAITLGFGFSFICLFTYANFKKLPLFPVHSKNGIVFSILFLLEQALFVYALRHIPIAELFVVILATPVFVLSLSSLILKEHLSKREIIAIILGFLGAALVVGYPIFAKRSDQVANPVEIFAWFAAVANVVCNGSKILYLRKYCQQENTVAMSLCASLLLTLVFGFQLSSEEFTFPVSFWFIAIICGIFSATGFIFYVRSFQITKAALVSATQYSQIIWAILMGVFIFHEKLTLAGIAGSLLILTSGYFLYLRRNVEPAPSEPPQKSS